MREEKKRSLESRSTNLPECLRITRLPAGAWVSVSFSKEFEQEETKKTEKEIQLCFLCFLLFNSIRLGYLFG